MKNNLLNTEKALAAYFIIIVHTGFPKTFGVIANCIARFAVPLFFMISGYYLYSTDREKIQSKIPRKIKHIGKITIISSIIYLIWNILILMPNKLEIKSWLKSVTSLKSILQLILFNQVNYAPTLWFLFALLYCYIIMLFVNKFNLYKISYLLIPILLFVNIVGSDVMEMVGKVIPYLFMNFLFFGFPFFMLGNLINRKKESVKKISNKALFFLIVIGNLMVIIERFITIRKEVYFGSIIVVSCMFILSINNINNTDKFRCSIMENIGEKLSLFIYISHPIIIYIIEKFSYVINIHDTIFYKYSVPILTCIVTTILASIFYSLKKFLIRPKDKIINK